ncbi:MAG: hypothetical protein AB1540_11825 [Bdellovibrionota bacterium]
MKNSRARIRKPPPFAFVLEALEELALETRPMFGCVAAYLGEKILIVLREKEDHTQDNGVWIATSREHHESLKKQLPSMRSISFLGTAPTHWQVVPSDSEDFEKSVAVLCELLLKGDERIGKVPQRKKQKTYKAVKKKTQRKKS